MPTYDTILAGLLAVMEPLGLAFNLDYEPSTVGSTPGVYSLFDSWTPDAQGQLTKHTFRTLHRVVVTWQDNQGAEALLRPYLSSLPAAFQADPRLGGLLDTGYARIVEATGVYVVIGGVLCRGYDFVSDAFYKEPRAWPL